MNDPAEKTRKLLAKARSTTFPAEAAACRAKAAELMTKHDLSPADIDPPPARPRVFIQQGAWATGNGTTFSATMEGGRVYVRVVFQ